MMAALQNFRNMTVPHKMLLLGDMRELGADSPEPNTRKSLTTSKKVILRKYGSWENSLPQVNILLKLMQGQNVQEVIKDLQEDKPKGYTILIKGSNGIKLSSTVEFL